MGSLVDGEGTVAVEKAVPSSLQSHHQMQELDYLLALGLEHPLPAYQW